MEKQNLEKICEMCNSKFVVGHTKRERQKRFCNSLCSKKFNGLSNKGRKHSEETKKLLSELNSGEGNAFYGKSHTQECKDKISKKNKGKKRSEEFKKHLSELNSGEGNPFYGKIHSEETRLKISQNHADHTGENNPNYGNGDNFKGDKNPNWLGGISYGEYGEEFSDSLKTKIRQRDYFKCKICYKKGYDVHHIDYIKTNNTEENLVTLCRSCHAKTNFNRERWIAFFILERNNKDAES